MAHPRPGSGTFRLPLALTLAAVLCACEESPSPPPAPPVLVGLALSPDPIELTVGGTVQLVLTGTDSAGATSDLTAAATFAADLSGIATIGAAGLLTAVGPGSTGVTGTVTVGAVTLSASAALVVSPAGPADYDPGPGWTLAWADEFGGTEVDPASWTFDLGSGGWGNGESQYYRAENAVVAGGLLTITAREEAFGDAPYTSARLQTSRKHAFTYGKFVLRAKLPYSQAMWPAFWMLGANSASWGLYGGDVTWPGCGEIDVMEMIGGLADGSGDFTTHGTLHYLDASGRNPAPSFALRQPEKLSAGFHVFELVWTPRSFTWKVDGLAFGTRVVTDDMEEFHAPMFLLLNLAVGGAWGGWVDDTTVFPQTYAVDWVRVYDGPATEPGGAPGLATTWHLSNAAAAGVGPGAESLGAARGTASGFGPLKVLGPPATWFSPPLTGSFEEGAWSVGLFTTSPAGPATVRAEAFVTAADGGAPVQVGRAELDVSKTGNGHHLSWFGLTGVPAVTLSNQRLKLVVTQLDGPEVTLVYNGNDFDSRLTTPWSAAP